MSPDPGWNPAKAYGSAIVGEDLAKKQSETVTTGPKRYGPAVLENPLNDDAAKAKAKRAKDKRILATAEREAQVRREEEARADEVRALAAANREPPTEDPIEEEEKLNDPSPVAGLSEDVTGAAHPPDLANFHSIKDLQKNLTSESPQATFDSLLTGELIRNPPRKSALRHFLEIENLRASGPRTTVTAAIDKALEDR